MSVLIIAQYLKSKSSWKIQGTLLCFAWGTLSFSETLIWGLAGRRLDFGANCRGWEQIIHKVIFSPHLDIYLIPRLAAVWPCLGGLILSLRLRTGSQASQKWPPAGALNWQLTLTVFWFSLAHSPSGVPVPASIYLQCCSMGRFILFSSSQTLMWIRITWRSCSNADSDSVALAWGGRIFISSKLPDEDTAGSVSQIILRRKNFVDKAWIIGVII